MSRLNTEWLASMSTPIDERRICSQQKQKLEFAASLPNPEQTRRKQNDLTCEVSPTTRGRSGLTIEGAIADPTLAATKRELEREEKLLRKHHQACVEVKRLEDQVRVNQERADFVFDLIVKQEEEARETLEILFASKIVEVQRKERTRKQKEKMDEQAEDYLTKRDLIDDLHGSYVEYRWLTREAVLLEAEENRKAQQQVDTDWRHERETVFMDESDMFVG